MNRRSCSGSISGWSLRVKHSGAELEQVVVSALYTAFAAGRPLTNDLLLAELKQTPPIVSTAREKIAMVRAWGEGRAVPAD